MEKEYIIINKIALEKRIEELDNMITTFRGYHNGVLNGRVLEIKKILSESTPLIPEIVKTTKQ